MKNKLYHYLQQALKQFIHVLLKLTMLKMAVLFVTMAVLLSVMIVLTIDLLWDGRFNVELEFAGVVVPFIDSLLIVGLLVAFLSELRGEVERRTHSETKFRTLYDSTSDAVMLLDEKGFFDCNKAALDIFGCASREELINKHFSDLSPAKQPDGSDSMELANKIIATAMEKGSLHFDWMHKRNDTGEIFLTDVLLNAMKLDGKQILQAVVRDITERKKNDKLIENLNEQQRIILDASPAMIFYKDKENRFIRVNEAMARANGMSKEEMEGKTCWDIFPREAAESYWQDDKEVMTDGKPSLNIIEEMTTPQGTMWVQTDKIPYRNPKGEVIGIIGFTLDITERKQAEKALKHNEAFLNTLLNSIPIPVFYKDREGRYTGFNRAFETFFGTTKEQLVGKTVFDINPPELAKIYHAKDNELFESGVEQHYEAQVKNTRGITRDVIFNKAVFTDSQGNANGLIGAILDITERKQSESALRESDERYKALFDSSLDLVYLYDFEGRFIDANIAALNLFGYTREEIHSLNFASFLSEDQLPLAFKTLQEIQETGSQKDMTEFRLRHKNGSDVYVETIGSTIMSNGKSVAIQSIGRDITERKKVEEELRQSEERYRTILDEMENGYFEVDLAGKYTFVNDATARQLGYSKEELLGSDFQFGMVKESIEFIKKTFINIYKTDMPQRGIHYKALRKDGTTGFAEISGFPLKNKEGEIIGFRGLALDITERKKVEKVLKESENKYRLIADNMTDAISIIDMNLRFTYVSPSIMRIRGYTADEALAQTFEQAMTPESLQIVNKVFEEEMKLEASGTADPGRVRIIELEEYRKDMSTIWVEVSLSFLRDAHGRPTGMISLTRDITERKKVEAELRESEEKYRTILKDMDDVYFEIDIKGNITFVNPSSCIMSGYSEEELLGMSFKKISASDGIEKVIQYFGEIFLTGTTGKPFLWNLEKKNGEQGFFELVASLIRDKQGKPIGFRGIGRDVTERMKAEEELRQSEEKFRNIIENIQDGYIEVDLAGNWIFVNDAVVEYTLYSREELIGMHYSKLQTEKSIKDTFKIFNEIYKTGKPVKAVAIEGLRKDGTIGYYEFSISLNKNSKGKPIGFHCISRDITKRKKAEKELLDLNQELESVLAEANYLTVQADQANAAKSDFLANMSHEIRTPMNAIIGMADLLWDSQLTTEQRQYVQIFRSAGENLLILINDILDLSKVESGQLVLENMPYDLFDIVDKTCEVIALRAHGKNLELLCHINPDVPQNIHGDPTRLRQVLMNLLGNAVKFTEKGEIVLTVLSLPQDVSEKTPRCLQFSVRDTGIGIPADKLNIVFEKFTQSDNSITRKYEGTGLGLAISKQFIELMGGKIWVESRQGEGSTFFFTIPLEEAPPEKNQMPAFGQEVGLQGVNILIVDDNATNRLILRETLSLWGCIVTEASGGAAGLKELEKAKETGHPFRIAILDSQMPEMDGLTLAQKIRGKSDFATLSILMLTSERRSRDRIKAKAADITGYLIKPVKRDALRNALRVAMGREEILRKSQKPPEKSPAEDLRPLRILLVEDSEDNRFLVQAYLKNTKYLIDTAENGQVAVEKFLSNVYDLILMDVQMPVMDGYMATREIRRIEREEGRKPSPIVALTAHALKEDREKSLEIGFDDYLTKPIRKPVLLEAIQKMTSKEKDE